MKKKIAIIGAGIAGLTLANLIKKNSNYEFMLYEKISFDLVGFYHPIFLVHCLNDS